MKAAELGRKKGEQEKRQVSIHLCFYIQWHMKRFWKTVLKSCPRRFASRPTVQSSDSFSALGIWAGKCAAERGLFTIQIYVHACIHTYIHSHNSCITKPTVKVAPSSIRRSLSVCRNYNLSSKNMCTLRHFKGGLGNTLSHEAYSCA